MAKRDQPLAVIRGAVPSLAQQFKACRFESRCDYAWDLCREQMPAWLPCGDEHQMRCHRADPSLLAQWPPQEVYQPAVTKHHAPVAAQPLLTVTGLKVHFPQHKGLFGGAGGYLYAVDGIDITIPRGRTVALVGESGCGKTTAGKAILQLNRPTAGEVLFEGEDLMALSSAELRLRRRDFQIIFQNAYSSMNPRMRVGDIIEEGMLSQGLGGDKEQRRARVDLLLEQVGLSATMRNRYPHEFSGGQRQRICIARALALNPKLIVCDEPTSALDVSVQAQILNLLKELQDELGISYLFITHNISVVAYLAHEIQVMYLGRIVEQGSVTEVLQNPLHPYTQALLAAVPTIDAVTQHPVVRLEGDLPSPLNPPPGCHFHPRCPQVRAECRTAYPVERQHSSLHKVHCHLY